MPVSKVSHISGMVYCRQCENDNSANDDTDVFSGTAPVKSSCDTSGFMRNVHLRVQRRLFGRFLGERCVDWSPHGPNDHVTHLNVVFKRPRQQKANMDSQRQTAAFPQYLGTGFLDKPFLRWMLSVQGLSEVLHRSLCGRRQW